MTAAVRLERLSEAYRLCSCGCPDPLANQMHAITSSKVWQATVMVYATLPVLSVAAYLFSANL
eukprot:498245-Amphidinium_carterae.1